MSCHVIYYENGAKRMRPVLTATEYRNLRNSNRQKALVEAIRKGDTTLKNRLMQMNYSCIPSGDMKLKGCKTPSMTVGMDVDFDPSAPDYDEKMATAPQRVLAKKDELGLLLLERSARKGYHLVFRRHTLEGIAEGKVLENQELNLRWASDLLGVKFDNGAKDITRVFFTTTASEEDLLFLDEALFEQGTATSVHTTIITTPTKNHQEKTTSQEKNESIENHLESIPPVAQNEKTEQTEVAENTEASNAMESSCEELSYNGIPYSDIIDKYFELYNGGKHPTVGDRNVKTFELAVTLRSICDYDQAKLEAVIPRYEDFPEAEWRRTIQSALGEPRKGMPYRLCQVLAAIR